MLKTMIRLPDGREIASGAQEDAAVMEAKLTQWVNDTQECNPGAVCAAMLELELWDPIDTLDLHQADEIRAFRIDGEGVRHDLGIFRLEKPERPSPHILRITAYDRVCCLDKDLTGWLETLEEWPYSLLSFADMVCRA